MLYQLTPPLPYYDWTGFYAGINGGGSMGRVNWESDPDGTTGVVPHSTSLVGGTIGYNMQNQGQLVVGEEFDFNWRRYDFTILAATCGPTCELQSNWFSTARIRLGYQIDRFLPYLTGDLSMSDFTACSFGQSNGANRSVSFNFYGARRCRVRYHRPAHRKTRISVCEPRAYWPYCRV
jgi:hypothetical protein